MSERHLTDLRSALAYSLLGTPNVPSLPLPEVSLINRLVGTLRAYDTSEIGASEMRAVFQDNPIPGFDFNQWLSARISDGTYDQSVLEDDLEDE